ncbi:MAG: hypothetical protein ACRDT2_19865, partial [Natronosporangium sp.]
HARWVSAARVVAVLTGVVGACLACSSPSDDTFVLTQTDPSLVVHNQRGSGDDAEIEGYLRFLDHARCFVLESALTDDSQIRHVPVWPSGAQPIREGDAVVGVLVPDVGEFRVGDWVSGGGGYVSPGTSDQELPDMPADCLSGGGEFARFDVIETGG